MNNENILESHEERVDPETAFIMCIIAVVLACLLVPVHCCLCLNNNWFWNRSGITCLISCLFLAANIVFLVYSVELRDRDAQDYQGLMRVTDVRYETREVVRSGHRRTATSYEQFYDARFTVDWGYTWGCPEHSLNQSCTQSKLTYCSVLICQESSCSSREEEKALVLAQQCAEQVYNPRNNYTAYDPNTGPSNDTDWPSIVAYGDCSSCKVQLQVASISAVERLRVAGFWMLGITGFLVLTLLGHTAFVAREKGLHFETPTNWND